MKARNVFSLQYLAQNRKIVKKHKIEFSDKTLQRTFNDLIIFSLLVAFSDIYLKQQNSP